MIKSGLDVVCVSRSALFVVALGGCASNDSGQGAAGAVFGELQAALVAPEECVVACPVDHPQVSQVGDTCLIGDGLDDGASPVVMTEGLELCPGTYVLTDQLLVGDGSVGDAGAGTELGLHAGVTILGNEGTFISVQRGSRLVAEGSSAQPVVFTSAQPEAERAAGDWEGWC